MFQTSITAVDSFGKISFLDGHGEIPDVKLIGSTFLLAPIGTSLAGVSARFPDGQQAFAVSYRIEKIGNQPTSEGIALLLSWNVGEMVFIKRNSSLRPNELIMFNQFVLANNAVLITDAEHKVAYVSGLPSLKAIDPEWTYKVVSMDTILRYITKQISLEELDKLSALEQRSRTKLAELLESNSLLSDKLVEAENALQDEKIHTGMLQRDVDLLHAQNMEIVEFRETLRSHWGFWISTARVRAAINEVLARKK